MVVITARSALDGSESFAAVGRAIDGNVGQIHRVGIFGIDGDFTEIPQPSSNPTVGPDQSPASSGVIGAEQAAIFGVDERVDSLATSAASHGQAHASPIAAR